MQVQMLALALALALVLVLVPRQRLRWIPLVRHPVHPRRVPASTGLAIVQALRPAPVQATCLVAPAVAAAAVLTQLRLHSHPHHLLRRRKRRLLGDPDGRQRLTRP